MNILIDSINHFQYNIVRNKIDIVFFNYTIPTVVKKFATTGTTNKLILPNTNKLISPN